VIKAVTLGRLPRSWEAVGVYDEVVARFGDDPEPALREQVATALMYKAIALGQIDRSQAAPVIHRQVVANTIDLTVVERRPQKES